MELGFKRDFIPGSFGLTPANHPEDEKDKDDKEEKQETKENKETDN